MSNYPDDFRSDALDGPSREAEEAYATLESLMALRDATLKGFNDAMAKLGYAARPFELECMADAIEDAMHDAITRAESALEDEGPWFPWRKWKAGSADLPQIPQIQVGA